MQTVMLVDDSTTLLRSMQSLLEKSGYAVITSERGEDALAKAQGTSKADLIITDLNMPGMDGIDVVKAFRGLKDYRFTPILLLTTESQQSKRQEARAAGATGWLVKPVKHEDLVDVLNKLLPKA